LHDEGISHDRSDPDPTPDDSKRARRIRISPNRGKARRCSRIVTAVSGGFTHVYAAVDARLFEKYGLRTEQIYIQGSGPGLTALTTNEIQFLYCAGDATIPGLAAGVDVKLVGSPLVGMPYVLLARKDIKRVEDLKGKSIGYSRPGQVDHRLARAILKNSIFRRAR
jgi:ABC-type nitrate/sulfonate/bicarbonate transport system substrate-binding protein